MVSDQPVRVLVVTKGHPFDHDAFFVVFDANRAIEWRHVEHPAAVAALAPEALVDTDVVVFYDMPGIRFTRADPPAEFDLPPPELAGHLAAMAERGVGLVFCHHAIAGWPAWPDYAELLGARFHYLPGHLAGVDYPDSGYRHDVTHTVTVLDPQHPVCAGLGESFTLTDELYLFPVLEDRVVPLLRTDHPMTDDGFYSARLAISGTRSSREGWHHPPGSQLVGWLRARGRSPIVYLQFGDGPVTYADPSFRTVLANAIDWSATEAARIWAAGWSAEHP